jgi:hypothetical protein
VRRLILALVAAVAFGLPGAHSVSAMSFSLANLSLPQCEPACPLVIVASGEIALNSDQDFFDFVRTQVVGRQVAQVVVMSSPGGNLMGSLKLGVILRQLRFSTMVGQVRGGSLLSGACYSACAYAVLGGRQRLVPQGSQVGVHRAWLRTWQERDIVDGGFLQKSPALSPQAGDGVDDVLRSYLRHMGISPQLAAIASSTPSDQIRILTRQELSQLRIVRGGERRGERGNERRGGSR